MSFFGLNWQINWACRYSSVELCAKERDQLRAMVLWQETKDVKLVCRTFQMSQATLTAGAIALTTMISARLRSTPVDPSACAVPSGP